MLNPRIFTNAGSLYLEWDIDPAADCYHMVAPDGSVHQVGKAQTVVKLGQPTQPFTVSVASAVPQAAEKITYPEVQPPPPPPTIGIPSQGFSTGSIFSSWDKPTRTFVIQEALRIANGHPENFAMRFDAWDATTPVAFIDECLAAGIRPYLVLDGTTGPRAASGIGKTLAAKYKGKGLIFTGCNEPSLHGWGADQLADYCKATYQQVKAGDPDALCGYAAMWKEGAGLQAYARSAAARAKGFFDFFPFHGYDDPSVHASWPIWEYVFDGGYYGTNTVQTIFRNAGINVPFVSDECGSKAAGAAQWDPNAIKELLDQAPGRVAGSYIFSPLPDHAGGWQIIEPNHSEHVAYTSWLAYRGGH